MGGGPTTASTRGGTRRSGLLRAEAAEEGLLLRALDRHLHQLPPGCRRRSAPRRRSRRHRVARYCASSSQARRRCGARASRSARARQCRQPERLEALLAAERLAPSPPLLAEERMREPLCRPARRCFTASIVVSGRSARRAKRLGQAPPKRIDDDRRARAPRRLRRRRRRASRRRRRRWCVRRRGAPRRRGAAPADGMVAPPRRRARPRPPPAASPPRSVAAACSLSRAA